MSGCGLESAMEGMMERWKDFFFQNEQKRTLSKIVTTIHKPFESTDEICCL